MVLRRAAFSLLEQLAILRGCIWGVGGGPESAVVPGVEERLAGKFAWARVVFVGWSD